MAQIIPFPFPFAYVIQITYMDRFHEPRRVPEPGNLEDLTSEVLARGVEYRAKGIPLSGRVLHLCHYLPLTAMLYASSRPGHFIPTFDFAATAHGRHTPII